MKIKISRKTKNPGTLPKMERELKKLESHSLTVGIFDEWYGWLANIHEHGAQISAKKGKYLAIPAQKQFIGVSPRSVSGLFFVSRKPGSGVLARSSGKGDIEVCYILKTSIKIPERAYFRQAYEELGSAWADKYADYAVRLLENGALQYQALLAAAGLELSSKIRARAVSNKTPPNSPLTAKLKGSSNPLVDTGGMIGATTFEIE